MDESSDYPRVTRAEGYALGHLDDLGGERRVRASHGRSSSEPG